MYAEEKQNVISFSQPGFQGGDAERRLMALGAMHGIARAVGQIDPEAEMELRHG